MSKIPTKQLTKTFEKLKSIILKDTFDEELIVNLTYGRNEEHRLRYEKMYDGKYAIKGHIISYYHYGILCFQLRYHYCLSYIELEITEDCYSNTDRDNINGLLSLMNIRDIKAYKEGYNILFKVYGKKTNKRFVDIIR